MREPDSRAVRTSVRPTMSKLRALITVLCVLAVAMSAAFVSRPALAAGKIPHAHQIMLAADHASGVKKPCKGAGLLQAGTVCNTGVFLGLSCGSADVIAPSACQADARPLRRLALAAQCNAGSLFRPPRVDA